MKEIPITKGYVALVDDEDFDWLSQWKWQARFIPGRTVYAQRTQRLTPGVHGLRKTITMHRAIMNAPDGLDVDHVNLDGLDNRRANLRLCTPSQNAYNVGVRPHSRSGYKGVRFHKQSGLWRARITVAGVVISLGYHNTAEDAARAYDAAARREHGAFARVNFPDHLAV